MHIFTPHHVALLEACYPSSAVLRTDVDPKPQETSRLVYYASNRPEKLQKIGRELEGRALREIAKVQAGSGGPRYHNSLLVTLALLRVLTTECRQEISVLTPHLLKVVAKILESFRTDLALLARAAGMLTTWCTNTDGSSVSIDEENMIYLRSSLKNCGSLVSSKNGSNDDEMCNRRSLIGCAVFYATIDSADLMRSRNHSQIFLQLIIPALLRVISRTSPERLQSRNSALAERPQPMNYMSDFRPVALAEKQTPLIYVHVDGEQGPSETDVLDSCLRIFCFITQRASVIQLSQECTYLLEYLDGAKLWFNVELCVWLTSKSLEWAQFQNRYVIHTKILDQLMAVFPDGDDIPHGTLLRMLHSSLSSPIPVANLATSDVLKQLLAILLRLISSGCSEDIQDWVAVCISDLAMHIYYADQIQDLVQEVISKMTTLRVNEPVLQVTESIRVRYLKICLRILGYFVQASVSRSSSRASDVQLKGNDQTTGQEDKGSSRGTPINMEIWQPTLVFLVDSDLSIRSTYCRQLISYLRGLDLHQSAFTPSITASPLMNDSESRFLNALYANLYISITQQSLVTKVFESSLDEITDNGIRADLHPDDQRTAEAAKKECANLAQVLAALHTQRRTKSLFIGAPMLAALEGETFVTEPREGTLGNSLNLRSSVREVVISTWKAIAAVWGCFETIEYLDKLENPDIVNAGDQKFGVSRTCIAALAVNRNVLSSTGLNSEDILKRLTADWNVKEALTASSNQFSLPGSGSHIAPLPALIKLSPRLMHVENLSLSSITRSVRAVGAGDLRDALEGSPAIAAQVKNELNIEKRDHVKRRPSITKVTDSPGAVRDLFASIGLGIQKENT